MLKKGLLISLQLAQYLLLETLTLFQNLLNQQDEFLNKVNLQIKDFWPSHLR